MNSWCAMKNRPRAAVAQVLIVSLSLASVYALAPGMAWADSPDAGPVDVNRLQNELNHVKQEVRDQRQLILQLMQVEQQHYDMLLKFLNSGNGDAPPPLPPSALALPPVPRPAGADNREAGAPAPAPREFGTVSGHVRGGQSMSDVYVYVDGLRATPARNHHVEITQKDKQFSPRVTVVPVGTRVIFPNDDTVIHNVFSQNPGNTFDLGSVKSGEKSAPVVLLKPGHVEVYCNIHSKMRADILVVPNSHWTHVAADGSFQIPGVPAGPRRVVLWSPTLKPVSQDVDVTAKGGSVSFAAEATGNRPHMNKRGQAYGSYDE
jgi:plastocyanin